MAANSFRMTVANVGETRFDGDAISAAIPTSAGEITVLPNHEPLVATLRAGVVVVKTAQGEPRSLPIEGGVLEVSNNRVVVLL